MPYFATKGIHDYLEAGQTWESVWGYPAVQIIEAGPLTFIFADASCGDNLDEHSLYITWPGMDRKRTSESIRQKGPVYFAEYCPALRG